MSGAPEPSAWSEGELIDLRGARLLLNENDMFIEKGGRQALPPSVVNTVEQIMSLEFRGMSKETAVDITTDLAAYEGGNSFDRFAIYWRELTDQSPEKLVTVNGEPEYKLIDRTSRGLRWSAAGEFRHDGLANLPINVSQQRELAVALNVPKPRMIYGLADAAFSADEMRGNVNVARWAGLANGIWHPFMVIEAQCGNDTSIEFAEVRALRTGSALIRAHREMKRRAMMPDHQEEPGIDASAVVLSLCFTPAIAKLYVHWANDRDGTPKYYMNQIKRYLPDDEYGVVELRHDLDRIVDWGTSDRLDAPGGIKEMLWELKDKHINGF
ncbi:MAG: hypothetical protein Q9208_002456 [Pyrenodesmia sp. 3 TL-2023]